MEFDDLPFTADYAKSGRAICRGCQTAIAKGTLRMAIIMQSSAFDGRIPNWYHFDCFFVEHMPPTVSDIANYDSLRWDDKQKIQNILAVGESPFSSEEAKANLKRAVAIEASKATVQDYSIEYAKNNRIKCVHCEEKIMKDDIRISKKAKKIQWYHLKCFVKKHEEINYLECGNKLPGFQNLNELDQEIVKTELPGITAKTEEIPIKKQRLSKETEKINVSQEEIMMKEHMNVMYKYRDLLKKHLNKEQLAKLLKHNRQAVPSGIDNMLDRSCEMMTFGSLSRCPFCFKGQLSPTKGGYKCFGFSGAWSKCSAKIKNPIRTPVDIPKALQLRFDFLNEYEYIPRVRIMPKIIEETAKNGPLRTINLVIAGFSPEEENKIRSDISRLGGRVVNQVKRSVLAVISTPEEVKNYGKHISTAKECQVYVVSRDFLSDIQGVPHLRAEDIARKHSICEWGAELNNRVPEQFKRKVQTFKSQRRGIEEESKKKMCVKGGIAIEPESGLEHIAHVYQQVSVRFNAVLSRTDLNTNQNTYYKIQLLESDNLDEYWIYRTWGRIGTDVGSFKVENMTGLDEAKTEFKRLFKEKTGNKWENRMMFKKKPGLFSYVEVDYDAKKEEIVDLSVRVADSKLEPAVADLMATIFNMQSMEKLMLEYELDMQKMPLGKVSRYQIRQAYEVLTQASWQLNSKHKIQTDFIEYSNKFYSLMPHNSALERPPILNNMEIIKKKIEMLASLMEMETAYCMIQRNAAGENGNPLDAYYTQLCTDIETLKEDSAEYRMIQEYVTNTHAETHTQYDLQILEVFKINRHGELDRYKPFSNLHNRKLLWHGSRVTNFAGILCRGLRIAPPEAPVTGYMFGKGIYFADMVSKSANYCCTTRTDTTGLMLLCEVALGNSLDKLKADPGIRLPHSKHSVKGVGKTEPDPTNIKILQDGVQVPLGKSVTRTDISSDLLYNEYIVYNINQVNVKYLLKMNFKFKN